MCMPTGGCADPNSIIHAISSGGSNMSTCGSMSNACNLDTALTLATSGRNVIKLDDAASYTSETDGLVVDTDAAIGLTIDAHGATLHRNNDGPILTINGGKAATILGVLSRARSGATATISDAIATRRSSLMEPPLPRTRSQPSRPPAAH